MASQPSVQTPMANEMSQTSEVNQEMKRQTTKQLMPRW